MNKTQSPKDAKVRIIPRKEIPSLHEIKIDGKMHNLGTLKDFRKHPMLANFIPDQTRLSMSWVSLGPNEVLNTHEHPTASMIIICEGEGEVIGACQQRLKAGDIAAIPPYNKHGFIGRGKRGFWGLSIQFEGLGLYENREAPRVHFFADKELEQPSGFDLLLQDQHHHESVYRRFVLLNLLKSPYMKEPAVQERLLEVLNHWGNWFQRILFARAAVGGQKKFQDIAEDHIREEAGHNKNLFVQRGSKPIDLWDPILEAAASWFYEKMHSASDAERTILVHFVLEGSGEIFHLEAGKVFPHMDHFRLHGEVDDEHFAMGCRVLQETPGLDFEALRETLRQGWGMMEVLCNRMAYLAKHGNKREKP